MAKVGRERAVVVPATCFAVRVVEAQTPAARGHGVAQRSLRLIEQSADRLAVGSPRRADTHREGHERPRDVDRLADQTFDPAGDGDRFVAVLNGAAHREAIAVEADDEIVAPDRGRQPARDLDQDRIARRRTETGVHEIEVIDVEQDDDRRFTAGDIIEVVQQRDSSCEPGQIVAVPVGDREFFGDRHAGQLYDDLCALVDVVNALYGEVPDQAIGPGDAQVEIVEYLVRFGAGEQLLERGVRRPDEHVEDRPTHQIVAVHLEELGEGGAHPQHTLIVGAHHHRKTQDGPPQVAMPPQSARVGTTLSRACGYDPMTS